MEEPGRLQSMGSPSRTWLSDFTFTFNFYALEKEVATHSSVLAWRIPGMGSHRVGHDWSDLAEHNVGTWDCNSGLPAGWAPVTNAHARAGHGSRREARGARAQQSRRVVLLPRCSRRSCSRHGNFAVAAADCSVAPLRLVARTRSVCWPARLSQEAGGKGWGARPPRLAAPGGTSQRRPTGRGD